MNTQQTKDQLQAKARAKLAAFHSPQPSPAGIAPDAPSFVPVSASTDQWLSQIDAKLWWTNCLLLVFLCLFAIGVVLSTLGWFFGFVGGLMH